MQNQPQQGVQQQPTVVMVPPQALEDKFSQRALSQMRVLSILQNVIGCLCIVFGAVLTGLFWSDNYNSFSVPGFTGAGIWVGAWYVIVGGIGIGAVRRNTSCWITSTMVLNIISCLVWSCALIGLSVMGLLFFWTVTDFAMSCILLLMAFAQFVIAIWSAALCCEAVCRCCKPYQIPEYYTTGKPVRYSRVPAAADPGAQPVAV